MILTRQQLQLKTFTIKVENFDPDIDIWRNQISVSNVQHDDLECRCKDKIFPYTKPQNQRYC